MERPWTCGKKVKTFHLDRKVLILVYQPGPNAPPLTMLTDTFTAQAFFHDFEQNPERALRWGSLRQDSGDPFKFVKDAKEAYRKVEDAAGVERKDGVVAKGKRIIFSDGLDIDTAIALQKGCDEIEMAGEWSIIRPVRCSVSASFGIGTFLSNDFMKASNPEQVSKPLNIVIKLNKINGKYAVKLSDDKGKVNSYVFEFTQRLMNSIPVMWTRSSGYKRSLDCLMNMRINGAARIREHRYMV